ncbi:MAG: glucodextranase DOMON-like domain-containing protein [Thermoleophilaceae bacterium]
MLRAKICAAVAGGVLMAISAPAANAGSLYSGAGHRPGPDILYASAPRAPQLENTGIWHAQPILVSGASAYRSGEFLYQDYLYDDHGADSGVQDPGDPRYGFQTGDESSGPLFSQANGEYTYPTDPKYANDAADFVEVRAKQQSGAAAFRVTLNTLNDPSLVGFTIALGDSATSREFPHGANAHAPAQLFVTVHGTTGDLVNAADGTTLAAKPAVSLDRERRQYTVVVPRDAYDPRGQVVRVAAGVGLWDGANDRYLVPQQAADATHAGGAGTLSQPTAFFNVAFRNSEPMPNPGDVSGTASNPKWWRDSVQGQELKKNDLSAFHADVDFRKLERGTTDNSAVPAAGPIDRIFASHFETEQGVNWSKFCGGSDECVGEYRGQLQPYAIYVPKKPRPASGYGLTLLLHSLSANYNQYLDSRNQSQFGERGPGSIVITAEGRGPDGWYYDYAGADTFEMWADVARHYQLDPDWTAISGYSMGGYATYKFSTQYPDLFAKAQPVVGPPGDGVWVPPLPPSPGGDQSNTFNMLPSLRNVPIDMWVATTDELVPFAGTSKQAQGLDDLGYRYEFRAHQPADHLTLAINDEYSPAADFLGTTKVDRNPPHVTYVRNPTMDFSHVGTTADHAYWLSEIAVRDNSGSAPRGTIDVRSDGFGVGDAPALPTRHGGGVLTGGNLPAISYASQSKDWGPVPPRPAANVLHIDAKNIAAVTIDPGRARVNCRATLDVTTDGPLSVTLAGCGRTESFPSH